MRKERLKNFQVFISLYLVLFFLCSPTWGRRSHEDDVDNRIHDRNWIDSIFIKNIIFAQSDEINEPEIKELMRADILTLNALGNLAIQLSFLEQGLESETAMTDEQLTDLLHLVFEQTQLTAIGVNTTYPEISFDAKLTQNEDGLTNCQTASLSLNPDLKNNQAKLLWVATHELMHYASNLCFKGSMDIPAVRLQMEQASQIRTIQILSQLVDGGRTEFLPALLYGLREMAVYSTIYVAIKNPEEQNTDKILKAYFQRLADVGANEWWLKEYTSEENLRVLLSDYLVLQRAEFYGWKPLNEVLGQFRGQARGKILAVDSYGRGSYISPDLSNLLNIIETLSE